MKSWIITILLFFLPLTSSNAQFLLVKGVSGPTSFPFGTGPYGVLNGTTQTDGNVVVPSGSTLVLTAGTVYDFKSLTVNSGGTVQISGHGIVLIGSVGAVIVNGTILSDKASTALGACSKSFTITEPGTSTTYSFSYNFGTTTYEGGRGGYGEQAWNYQNYASVGGDGGMVFNGSSCGIGSGGGGGGAVDPNLNGTCACPPPAFCKICTTKYLNSGSESGVTASSSSTGSGGAGGNGGNGSSGNTAGTGGGAAGGRGSYMSNANGNYGGGGGGGGFRGGSASSLVIKTRANVTGTGIINLSGQAGFNGGRGGNPTGTHAGAGGGGGGGTGGFGGNLTILHKTGNSLSSSNYSISGGSAGLGGDWGTPNWDGAAPGTAGKTGGAGTYTSSSW